MKTGHFLNNKEKQRIIKMLEDQFGFSGELDYVFVQSAKNNIYLVNKEISDIDLEKLKINSVGLYIGELSNGALRLGIEGAQVIGPKSTHHILDLNQDQAVSWLKGEDMEMNQENGIYLIKHNSDFVGCGVVKNNTLLNFVPKIRRLNLQGEYFD